MSVIVGPVLDALGLAQRRELYQPPGEWFGQFDLRFPRPELRSRSWMTPATELRRHQPASTLNFGHEPPAIGDVAWLERDTAQRAWAVCVTDADVPDGQWYYSAETDANRDGTDVVLTGLGLVRRTAQISLFPVTVLPGSLDDYHRAGKRSHLDHVPGIIVGHASDHHHYPWLRARGEGLTVADMNAPKAGAPVNQAPASRSMTAPPGEPWIRTAQQLDIQPARRRLELIVVPYETETLVPYQGRMVRERIARGAFDDVERQGNSIRVNRDHDNGRVVGRVTALHPRRPEGLVAEVTIARTALGDETLALAADDCLDASAAFLPMPGGMEWQERNAYRVTKAWLGHVALTPDPAYPTARVLAASTAAGTLTA